MAPASRFVKGKVERAGRGLGLVAVLLAVVAPDPSLGAREAFDTRNYARVLERFVTPTGQVQYALLRQYPRELHAFLDRVARVSPESRPDLFPTPEARMAYWINTYNAFVLQAVVEAYPIDSVRNLKSGFGLLFFKRAKFTAGERKYSLDEIEHEILRKQFADPRIHFAINCASRSCPLLAAEPFLPERLHPQLETAARIFIRDQRNVWMRGDVLFLSEIFDWYEEDFLQALEREGKKTPTLLDYVLPYLDEETQQAIRAQEPRIEFFNYDWSLNDASKPTK